MAFVRPTIPALIARARADVSSAFAGAVTALRRSVLDALVKALAGLAHGLHGHLDWISRQVLITSADADLLDEHGSLWGIPRNVATYAVIPIDVTGVTGVTLPATSTLVRGDGALYEVDADVTMVLGTGSGTATAIEPGAAGNCDPGDTLTVQTPVAGIDSEVTVGTTGGTDAVDEEGDEDYRLRIVARIQDPPHGGAAADYVAWAREVAGVTRAWCVPEGLGPGTVTVWCVRDGESPIYPDAGERAAIEAHIDSVRPVTADVTVPEITGIPVAVEITGLTPDTAAVRAAVAAELASLFLRVAQPERGAGEATIRVSWIWEAVSVATGEQYHSITDPVADVTFAVGEMPELGTVTYVP